MDWRARGLVIVIGIASVTLLGVVMIEVPAAIGFGLSVALACAWCYWLEKKAGRS